MRRRNKSGNWIRSVKTVSTFPPQGTFTHSSSEIARIMARRDASPFGIGSAVRMIQYFINRAGRNLPPKRYRALEGAKRILRRRMLSSQRGSGARHPHR